MKKKLFACLLSAAMVLSLAACGGTTETETTDTEGSAAGRYSTPAGRSPPASTNAFSKGISSGTL